MIAIICKNCKDTIEIIDDFFSGADEIIEYWFDGHELKNTSDKNMLICECNTDI